MDMQPQTALTAATHQTAQILNRRVGDKRAQSTKDGKKAALHILAAYVDGKTDPDGINDFIRRVSHSTDEYYASAFNHALTKLINALTN